MMVGSLVRYIGDWHYIIDQGNRLGIVMGITGIFLDRLNRRRVLFNGNFETVVHVDKLDVVNKNV